MKPTVKQYPAASAFIRPIAVPEKRLAAAMMPGIATISDGERLASQLDHTM